MSTAVVDGVGVDAVVFDWGGTLAPHLDIDLLELWRAAAERLDPFHAEELAAQLVAVEAELWARTTATQESGTLDDLIALATARLGLDVAEAVRAEAALDHLDAWGVHLTHDPEAVATLTALRERGMAVGLVSNTHWPRAFHEQLLERDGLIGLIDVRLYSSELTHMKPHPSVFQAALAALGTGAQPLAAGRAVFVGDRPLDDIAGAKGIGMRAVLRPNPAVPGGPVEPDACITSLPELLPLIDGWRRSSARPRTSRRSPTGGHSGPVASGPITPPGSAPPGSAG